MLRTNLSRLPRIDDPRSYERSVLYDFVYVSLAYSDFDLFCRIVISSSNPCHVILVCPFHTVQSMDQSRTLASPCELQHHWGKSEREVVFVTISISSPIYNEFCPTCSLRQQLLAILARCEGDIELIDDLSSDSTYFHVGLVMC